MGGRRLRRGAPPRRDQLDQPRFDRLVSALAVIVGWEALIVQRDICGLTREQGEELSVWAARALLNASLADAEAASTS